MGIQKNADEHHTHIPTELWTSSVFIKKPIAESPVHFWPKDRERTNPVSPKFWLLDPSSWFWKKDVSEVREFWKVVGRCMIKFWKTYKSVEALSLPTGVLTVNIEKSKILASSLVMMCSKNAGLGHDSADQRSWNNIHRNKKNLKNLIAKILNA